MFWLWVHVAASAIAMALMVVAAALALIRKFRFHKQIGIGIALFGLIGLAGFFGNGCALYLNNLPSLGALHSIFGIASLLLSIAVFLFAFAKKRFHCIGGYVAALLALAALLTGVLAHGSFLLPSTALGASGQGSGCITLQQLQQSDKCLFAVDGVVYDMTSMPQWNSKGHVVDGENYHACGGSLAKKEMMEMLANIGQQMHEAEKYFGPVVGRLCD